VEPQPSNLDVRADPRRLEQALTNMVENALHHGAAPIRLTALERNGFVELHVTDGGPGFAPEFLPRAFERFAQADDSRTTRGTGLGLAIVHAIARAHGGSVHAANLAGGGADVWIAIACDEPTTHASASATIPAVGTAAADTLTASTRERTRVMRCLAFLTSGTEMTLAPPATRSFPTTTGRRPVPSRRRLADVRSMTSAERRTHGAEHRARSRTPRRATEESLCLVRMDIVMSSARSPLRIARCAFRRPPLDVVCANWGLGSTESSRTCFNVATGSRGRRASIREATPLTWAVAIEAPDNVDQPPPGQVLRMFTPGAARSTDLAPKLEKGASASVWSLAATHTTLASL
jgi:hypothetical protein